MRCQVLEGQKEGISNVYKPQDVRSHEEDWHIWGGVTLEWFIKKQDHMMGTGFSWLRRGFIDEIQQSKK
jgi:hypothetical protein